MNHIFLHIGHGKTGTSFLQSFMAINTENFSRNGLIYPISEGGKIAAASNQTTSGNHGALLQWLNSVPEKFSMTDDLLFSGETIYKRFSEPEFLKKITHVVNMYDKKLELLLFIRDPVEYQISGYLQRVQQGHCSKDINEYIKSEAAENQINLIRSIDNLMNICEKSKFALTIVNYSRDKNRLVDIFRKFIKIPEGTELSVPKRIVNRSLTAFDVGVQQAILSTLNGREGVRGKNHLKSYVDNTPHVKGVLPAIDFETLKSFQSSVGSHLEAMNARLSDAQKYFWDVPEYDAADIALWKNEQIHGFLLAETIIKTTLLFNVKSSDPANLNVSLAAGTRLLSHSDKRARAAELFAAKKYSEALPFFEDILKKSGKPLEYYSIAKCLEKLGRFKDALPFAQKCFTARPDFQPNATLLFEILISQEEYLAATEIVRAFIADKKNSEHLRDFFFGRIALAQGHVSVARDSFNRALLVQPANKVYLAWSLKAKSKELTFAEDHTDASAEK